MIVINSARAAMAGDKNKYVAKMAKCTEYTKKKLEPIDKNLTETIIYNTTHLIDRHWEPEQQEEKIEEKREENRSPTSGC